MDNLTREIEKLRFQIRCLAEHLDLKDDPMLRLVLRLNWGEQDLVAVHEIIEAYGNLLESDKESTLPEFEKKLRDRFGLDHQEVKAIVLAFYDSGQFVEVCRRAAALDPVSEYQRINHPRQRHNTEQSR